MKRTICVLLAALLACLPAAAMAEAATRIDQAVIDAFTDTWVSQNGDTYAAEIWYEDDGFVCRGTRFIDVDDGYSWEFESCDYDAAANALVCEGGVLVHEVFSEAEDRIVSEEVATGFGATLTMDENHHIHWTGSGDAIPDQVFASLDEVGEANYWDDADEDEDDDDADDDLDDPFVGEWVCERASIFIDEDDGAYNVHITWGSSAFEEVVWDYNCTLDSATGMLTGMGKKSDETYDENGEFISSREEYDNGIVNFTIDGDTLIWADAVEDAGQGMRFERNEPEGDAEDDFFDDEETDDDDVDDEDVDDEDDD